MAEKTVRIEGAVTTSPSGTQDVNIASTLALPMYTTALPTLIGAYVYSQAEVAGVVAANNFMTLTNPVGSGRTLLFAGAFISSYIVGDTAATITSMRGYRASAVSGGTLQAASTVGKFRTSASDPIGQIRTGGVTATLGTALFNSPPFIGAAKGSSPFVHQVPVPAAGGPFTLMEGESLVMRTEAGDVDTRWNLSLAWAEV